MKHVAVIVKDRVGILEGVRERERETVSLKLLRRHIHTDSQLIWNSIPLSPLQPEGISAHCARIALCITAQEDATTCNVSCNIHRRKLVHPYGAFS